MAEIIDIVPKLLDRTKQKKIHWKPTADENSFVAVIGSNSVIVSSLRGLTVPDIVLRILDKNGRELDRLDSTSVGGSLTTTEGSLAAELKQLYEKARGVALSVPSELDELLQELERI